MPYSLIIPSFIAGILTFFAPCTLPLVPGYLGFISGTSLRDLKDPQKSKKVREKIFLNGLFFIVGFSAVFIILGTAAGFVGKSLFHYRFWISRVGGVFIITFGLFMMGIVKLQFFNREKKFFPLPLFKRGKFFGSFLFGSTFALGWTPCVGPILGSILTLAALSTTAGEGAFLLFLFSLGLAVPFLLIALGIGWASDHLAKLGEYLDAVSFVGGVFLVFLGIFVVTNSLGIWTSYFYHFFGFIHYNQLLDYL